MTTKDPAPTISELPELPELPDNPWRESLQNCMTGDNYLRSTEWHQLIEELDRLYLIEDRAARRSTEGWQPIAPNLGDSYEPTMNIRSLPGTVVRFRGAGGYEGERQAALKAGFIKNALYTVKRCDVDRSHTDVLFDEIEGRWNSCLFADATPLHEARNALKFAKDALAEEHGGDDFEAECNLCQAYREASNALAALPPAPTGAAEEKGQES